MPETPSPAAARDEATPSFSPLYQQIKTLLTTSLEAGQWQPGQPIPSETELAARFGVSQGTVRKAIDEMAAENLLVRRQGKGTFVATHAEAQTQYRFLRLTPDAGAPAALQRRLLDCRRMRAPVEVARAAGAEGRRSRGAGAPPAAGRRRPAGGARRPVAARHRVQGPDDGAAAGLAWAAVPAVRSRVRACG